MAPPLARARPGTAKAAHRVGHGAVLVTGTGRGLHRPGTGARRRARGHPRPEYGRPARARGQRTRWRRQDHLRCQAQPTARRELPRRAALRRPAGHVNRSGRPQRRAGAAVARTRRRGRRARRRPRRTAGRLAIGHRQPPAAACPRQRRRRGTAAAAAAHRYSLRHAGHQQSAADRPGRRPTLPARHARLGRGAGDADAGGGRRTGRARAGCRRDHPALLRRASVGGTNRGRAAGVPTGTAAGLAGSATHQRASPARRADDRRPQRTQLSGA